jgi:hypothetical protein
LAVLADVHTIRTRDVGKRVKPVVINGTNVIDATKAYAARQQSQGGAPLKRMPVNPPMGRIFWIYPRKPVRPMLTGQL